VKPALAVLGVIAACLAIGWCWLWTRTELAPLERLHGFGAAPARWSLAVMGDSDSHAYQDRLSFGDDPGARGGAHRAGTLQWTEVLHRTRGDAIDLGDWGDWGVRGTVARLQHRLGVPRARVPHKQDFRFATAISGAVCGNLTADRFAQLAPLLQLMDADPVRWRRGIVSIRIGANPLAFAPSLEAFANDPEDGAARAVLDDCVADIRAAVATLRERHPQVRIVLVGLFDNSNWARYLERWQSPEALDNIAAAIDRYDNALRALERDDPAIAFFDDRAWFRGLWGGRDPLTGRPAYREVLLGRGLRVTNTLGDLPSHACVADGHAGTVWNALWARAFIELLNRRFGLGIAPLGEDELLRVVDPDGRFGTR
jgi:hypothetical protein